MGCNLRAEANAAVALFLAAGKAITVVPAKTRRITRAPKLAMTVREDGRTVITRVHNNNNNKASTRNQTQGGKRSWV